MTSVVNIILTLSLPLTSSGVALCPGSGVGSCESPLSPGSGLAGGGLERDLCFSSPHPRGLAQGPSRCLDLVARAWSRMLRAGLQLISPLNILRTSAPVSKASPLTNCSDYCEVRTGAFRDVVMKVKKIALN